MCTRVWGVNFAQWRRKEGGVERVRVFCGCRVWFGKDKATATYGVLPAANVPPPYALAFVSALRFDHCGHRFVIGALDGIVYTWQLEVGGRCNICPTESSVCFNNHTAYVITLVCEAADILILCEIICPLNFLKHFL